MSGPGESCVSACRVEPDGIVHHGWSCPESDPLADILGALIGPPLDNPILERARQQLIGRWTGDTGDHDGSPAE